MKSIRNKKFELSRKWVLVLGKMKKLRKIINMGNSVRKCGFHDCQNQIKKQDGDAWLTRTRCNACLKRGEAPQCDACFLKNSEETGFTIMYDFSDVNTGENRIEKKVKGVKERIDWQKEVIQKFLAKNISAELRQELNLIFQKCCELEKILPQLEKLAEECEKKSQACRGEFVREKGGQQFNIYEYCFCDNCHKEAIERERKIEDDYQDQGLNKLKILSEEILDRIAAEIGGKETEKILWTSGNAEYTEEEFENHHKEIKKELERKLKEERDNLSPSQINHLESRLKLYNEWENDSSRFEGKTEEKNSTRKNENKSTNQLFWIIGLVGGTIILGIIAYFVYRHKKKMKTWQRK